MKVNQIRFEDKYIAIRELHEKENLSIILLCEIAGISRAAYYKRLKRSPSSRELQNEEIVKEMKALQEKVNCFLQEKNTECCSISLSKF